MKWYTDGTVTAIITKKDALDIHVLNRFVSYLYEGFPLEGEIDHVAADCRTLNAPKILDLHQSGFSLREKRDDET